ncbi:hypothetical protein C8J57DRAFT_1266258 [Mycena rebaudengoi]|nr:hypothetical protein C8J57DRAFT_1266258 [Mycena rebaudengoi]
MEQCQNNPHPATSWLILALARCRGLVITSRASSPADSGAFIHRPAIRVRIKLPTRTPREELKIRMEGRRRACSQRCNE